MSIFFRWNMFFTSFIPLWFSIVFYDIWKIVALIYSDIKRYEIIGKTELFQCIKLVCSDMTIEVLTIIILCVYSVISIVHINSHINCEEKSVNKGKAKILSAKRANKLSAEFFLAYILPMIAFDYGSLKDIILFIIYFSVLSFLCIRNSNVYTNIFLEFKGYKMYECDVECNVMNSKKIYKDCLVISKENLTQTVPRIIHYFDFDNYIFIDVGGTK